ncbi:hypothetical protein [Gracilinema caldarium]|uniref:Antitoxin n=1 Tax=Gracilinema caldarium (strain ATCC 51460 / DSM 7334 / H1) TaxID=744872 RepID=F8F179_GRAC1|nr:hypothetical protein [Gracilinema caldarium]AEJ18723.1 hypothetical protein Spica_0563 [Gracilinema caldarium DSM 7334]
MKSITIHGIDADLDKKITQKASEIGLSQNQTVKLLLQSTLNSDKKALKKESFSELFGKWTPEEKEEFEKNISDLETINQTDW